MESGLEMHKPKTMDKGKSPIKRKSEAPDVETNCGVVKFDQVF